MSAPGDFGPLLRRTVEGAILTSSEAETAFAAIVDGAVSPGRLAAFLVALRMRGETAGEIAALARALRARASQSRRDAAIFRHLRHRRRGRGPSTSAPSRRWWPPGRGVGGQARQPLGDGRCGSADLLEGLGVRADVDARRRAGRWTTSSFLYAPRLHPSMRQAAAVRRISDSGPSSTCSALANPAGARSSSSGSDPRWVVPVAEVLATLGSRRARGPWRRADEIALHTETQAAEVRDGGADARHPPGGCGPVTAPLEAVLGAIGPIM
jgi:anthranilate phosphoribosyltransferase